MPFNSYAFAFAFLPLSLAIHHRLRRLGFDRGSIPALTLLSLLKGSRVDQNPRWFAKSRQPARQAARDRRDGIGVD